MTPEQLREKCESSTTGNVVLAIPRAPRGERIRLLPKSGPYGKICNVSDGRRTIAIFEAAEVLAWLNEQEVTR